MYSLTELVERVAGAIERMGRGAVGCFVVRPKHVFDNRSGVHNTAATYVFEILARAGLAIKYEIHSGVKYVICRDSALYGLPKEELIKRIMEEIKRAEEKGRFD